MSITSILTAFSLIWKIWPIVKDVLPKVLTAVEHVAKTFSPPKPVSEMDEAEKIVWDNSRKLHVQIAVREFMGKEIITDSQLNWAIETVLQIKSFFPNKK